MKNDISKTYQVNGYKIYFSVKEWSWVAVNIFNIGVDSDLSLYKLKKRVKQL